MNFLFGAGFSANLLGTLSNNEVIFEALQKHQAKNEDERKKVTILSAFLYWSFFVRCIEPISKISTFDYLLYLLRCGSAFSYAIFAANILLLWLILIFLVNSLGKSVK